MCYGSPGFCLGLNHFFFKSVQSLCEPTSTTLSLFSHALGLRALAERKKPSKRGSCLATWLKGVNVKSFGNPWFFYLWKGGTLYRQKVDPAEAHSFDYMAYFGAFMSFF